MKQPNRKKASQPFEFCKACNLNHSQGRGHVYFPSHTRSLSTFLSRFRSKLSEVLFFLKYPSLLRPEHASLNRLWCVFCDCLVQELDSPFACGNAIKHLAGADHLKSVRDFLRKYGGGMDRVDSFRVSETDLLKWENCCTLLNSETSLSSAVHFGASSGPSKDIHNELCSVTTDRFDRNSNYSFEPSASNIVLPLQCHTNERYQVSHPEVTGVTNIGLPPDATSPFGSHRNMDPLGVHVIESTAKHLTAYVGSQHALNCCNEKGSIANSSSNQGVQRTQSFEGTANVLQNLTQIPRLLAKQPQANIHLGDLPPWLETYEESDRHHGTGKGLHVNSLVSHSNPSRKSQKLNPKRVGAAWAEKRKIELEMEKRGEIATNGCTDDWLPNFGRVWQSGTRKESRKEFEKEKQRFVRADSMSDTPIKLQPYVSKRMRMDESRSNGAVNAHAERNTNDFEAFQ